MGKPYIDRKTTKKLIKDFPQSFTKEEINILFALCNDEEKRENK